MKDERYLTLAKAFNFGKDGNVTVPLTAQSQGTIKAIASDYTVMMTRFLEDDKKDKAKETPRKRSPIIPKSCSAFRRHPTSTMTSG